MAAPDRQDSPLKPIEELINRAGGGDLLPMDAGVLDKLREYGFTSEELHRLVAPRRTLSRRIQNREPLTIREGDSAQRILHISEMADRIFGDRQKARRWLRKPSRALNGVVPLDLLASETGARLVEEELHRIEYGIYV